MNLRRGRCSAAVSTAANANVSTWNIRAKAKSCCWPFFFSHLFDSSLHLSCFCQGYGEPCHLCEFQQAPDVHSLKWCTSDFSKSDCEFSEGFHHAADLSLLMPQQMAMAVEKVQAALFELMFCLNPGASVHPIYCSISKLKDAAGGYAAVQQLCNCDFSLQLHRCCDALSSTGCTWLGSSVLPSWFSHQIRLDKKLKKSFEELCDKIGGIWINDRWTRKNLYQFVILPYFSPGKRQAMISCQSQAALRGIAVNQDGMSSTMTAPNGPSQTLVVQTALMEAKLKHHEARWTASILHQNYVISLVHVGDKRLCVFSVTGFFCTLQYWWLQVLHMECHGTGTPLGDPIEVGALQAGSLQEGARLQPMATSAVKTSVGHLEAGHWNTIH